MEKKKNNLIPIVIILIVLVLGLGGFIVYDKVLNNEDNDVVDNNKNCNNDYINKFYLNMSKNKQIQEFFGDSIYGIVDTKGNVYFNSDKNVNLTTNLEKKEYNIDGYITKIGSNSNIFKGYKIPISDVVNTYFSYVGNSGSSYVFLIKKDGNVGYIKIDKELDGISIKFVDTIANLKNIVSFTNVYHVDGSELCFIDINGNILSVHNYDLN